MVYFSMTLCKTVVLFPGHFIGMCSSFSCSLCPFTQECESLAKENAIITGHHNLRQKIQFHAATKIENNKLKEVGMSKGLLFD